jgi:hypothetical protein
LLLFFFFLLLLLVVAVVVLLPPFPFNWLLRNSLHYRHHRFPSKLYFPSSLAATTPT